MKIFHLYFMPIFKLFVLLSGFKFFVLLGVCGKLVIKSSIMYWTANWNSTTFALHV